jgi:hypothetical protein
MSSITPSPERFNVETKEASRPSVRFQSESALSLSRKMTELRESIRSIMRQAGYTMASCIQPAAPAEPPEPRTEFGQYDEPATPGEELNAQGLAYNMPPFLERLREFEDYLEGFESFCAHAFDKARRGELR